MSIFSLLSGRSSKNKVNLPAVSKVSRGFTLIELVTVILIMSIITTTLLIRQSRFDSSTVLRSLAYSVALSVRQAQVYGTSVVGTTTSQCAGGNLNASGVCFASAYGLYFDVATPTSYALFADLNGDGKYQANEVLKTFNLGTGYAISNFCATNQASIDRCSSAGAINSLAIVFKRPNPDASFVALDSGGNPIAGDTYSKGYVQIVTTSDAGNTKRVSVLTTGEVTVCTTVGC
jgi:prepilin-type N-terminal cleavage/methylation domain-containing protein